MPPLYRKFYCYLHSPEQTNTKQDLQALEKEILHVFVEEQKVKMEASPDSDDGEAAQAHEQGFVSYFPEYARLYTEIARLFNSFAALVQATYDGTLVLVEQRSKQAIAEGGAEIDEEKIYASLVGSHQWKGILFRMRKLGCPAREFLVLQLPLKHI